MRTKDEIKSLVEKAVRGELTSEEVADALIGDVDKSCARSRQESDRRLRKIAEVLQRETDPARVEELKDKLVHEFYYGDLVG